MVLDAFHDFRGGSFPKRCFIGDGNKGDLLKVIHLGSCFPHGSRVFTFGGCQFLGGFLV